VKNYVIPLSEKLCFEGSRIKFNSRKKGITKFSLIDGIILASTRSINQKLITMDNDFRKTKDAIVLK
jgi:predicted nucleic acid-binding protein